MSQSWLENCEHCKQNSSKFLDDFWLSLSFVSLELAKCFLLQDWTRILSAATAVLGLPRWLFLSQSVCFSQHRREIGNGTWIESGPTLRRMRSPAPTLVRNQDSIIDDTMIIAITLNMNRSSWFGPKHRISHIRGSGSWSRWRLQWLWSTQPSLLASSTTPRDKNWLHLGHEVPQHQDDSSFSIKVTLTWKEFTCVLLTICLLFPRNHKKIQQVHPQQVLISSLHKDKVIWSLVTWI